MNEKKITTLVSVLAFSIACAALVPVGMAAAEDAPLAQSNEGTDYCIPFGPEYTKYDGYAALVDLLPSTYPELELSELIIPETYSGVPVTTIGANALEYAYYLDRILIPDSVTTIEEGAFHGCYMIRSFTIPDSVTSINAGVFGGCEFMDTIILPDTVTSIGNGAFGVCRGLKTIVLPSGLKHLGESAFDYCDKLESVVIYSGLESIGEGAFGNVGAFKEVYFTGTQEEWEQIQIAENNDALLNAVIHCNYDAISAGDLNSDNAISAEDAAFLLGGAALEGSGGNSYFNGRQRSQADVNADGSYDSTDAAVILRYSAAAGTGEDVTLEDFVS